MPYLGILQTYDYKVQFIQICMFGDFLHKKWGRGGGGGPGSTRESFRYFPTDVYRRGVFLALFSKTKASHSESAPFVIKKGLVVCGRGGRCLYFHSRNYQLNQEFS